jgi:hypothetical protein
VISLLLAYFGKGKIPDSVRYLLMLMGLSLLVYRLKKIHRGQKAYEEASMLKYAIEKRKAQAVVAQAATPQIAPPHKIPADQTKPLASAKVSPQTLSGFFLN